jgi:chemotaxis regulatin CheY-phosphate phosphatase CheZ
MIHFLKIVFFILLGVVCFIRVNMVGTYRALELLLKSKNKQELKQHWQYVTTADLDTDQMKRLVHNVTNIANDLPEKKFTLDEVLERVNQ